MLGKVMHDVAQRATHKVLWVLLLLALHLVQHMTAQEPADDCLGRWFKSWGPL